MSNNIWGVRQVVPKLGLRETRLVLDNLSKLEQRFQHDGQRVLLKTKFMQSLLSTTSGSIKSYFGTDSSDKDSTRANAAAQEQFAFNRNGSPVA